VTSQKQGAKDGIIVLNATFNNISAISWTQFYWWKKSEYPEKTTELPWAACKLTTVVPADTDYIGSCKSNFHAITTTTVPKEGLLLGTKT